MRRLVFDQSSPVTGESPLPVSESRGVTYIHRSRSKTEFLLSNFGYFRVRQSRGYNPNPNDGVPPSGVSYCRLSSWSLLDISVHF